MVRRGFPKRLSRWRDTAASLAAIALTLNAGHAADLSRSQRSPSFDWSGIYAGAHVGYGAGTLGPDSNAVPLQGLIFPPSPMGLVGGYQAGINWQLRNGWVLGVEADATFPSPRDQARDVPRSFETAPEMIATARGRIGHAFGALLPFATAGVAFGRSRLITNDAFGDTLSTTERSHFGWTAGAGVEIALGGGWSGKIEYSYVDLARQTYATGDAARPFVDVAPQIHAVKFGMNYRLWDTPPGMQSAIVPLPKTDPPDWSIHAQATFLPQAYPGFRSPYQGANSLPGGGQGRETFTTSAFLGWRLWQGGEFYFNPELAQGFGLNSTLGLAGFSNGEAQKGGAPYPRFRPQRYVLKQTFGLGGEQEEVADSALQLGGKRDYDRITVSVGRFAIGDFFDGNAYAKDPRADFMNWAMWSSAAYDFPADLPGFTRGGVIEFNRKAFAIRGGLFQLPSGPNSDVFTSRGGGGALEFEGRYSIAEQPGKFRVGAFANRGNSANYRGVLAAAAIDPSIDINELVPQLRSLRTKTGFYLNGEQQIIPDVGAFARYSFNDGRNEIISFTDIDRSLSGGLSIKGSFWGRPTDTVGIGGAINGLSSAHRDFLAAGGLGLLIGDGRLSYRTERIFETYYAYALNRNFTVTADYQLIANPAYNADRGPVSLFSARVHGEF